MPSTVITGLTGDSYIDGLLSQIRWATSSLTYSFPASGSSYGSGYGSGEPTTSFAPLNATQQTAARAAFAMYSSVANLSFTETTSPQADIRLAMSGKPATAWAYYPNPAPEGGDIWFNRSDYLDPQKGNYAYLTVLHEIGHALGLKHPHEAPALPTIRDSMEYSVMSYRSYIGGSTSSGYGNEQWGYAQSLMMYDIAALQHMYGANFTTNSGNTTYSWSPSTGEMFINGTGQGAPGTNRILLTVWDGGGVDTYDLSNYTNDLKLDLRPGEWSTTSPAQLARLHYDGSRLATGNVANALQHNSDPRSLIENAIGGSGNDQIYGNDANNTLVGNGGNDVLYGLSGDDILNGLSGHDLLHGGPGSDLMDGGEGWDTAVFTFSLSQASSGYGNQSLLVSHGAELNSLRSIEAMQFTDFMVLQADPIAVVDDLFYLINNLDVAAARMNPEDHFAAHGWKEGRNPNALFDTTGYLQIHTDVAAAGMNPLEHYLMFGWKEGRDPSADFDTDGYLALNPDVAAANMNPLDHYLQFGIYEGRMILDDGLFG